jgi:hypothetical protein
MARRPGLYTGGARRDKYVMSRVNEKNKDGASVSARIANGTSVKWSSAKRRWMGSDGDECDNKRRCLKRM